MVGVEGEPVIDEDKNGLAGQNEGLFQELHLGCFEVLFETLGVIPNEAAYY